MKWIAALLAAAFLAVASPATAKERINQFHVAIDVSKNGEINVTETIEVVAEGDVIRHGIFRDLPRFYERDNDRLPYQYHVISVTRDGRREPHKQSDEDNAFRIRIGDEDRLVPSGVHTYEIRYRVRNQVRYFDAYDELYWNVTGNYWEFPIDHASATISLPAGARISSAKGFTGGLGQTGADYVYRVVGDKFEFATTRPLEAQEGLTVSLAFEKGLIDPPSTADLTWLWWQRNGALAVLAASLVGLFWFLYRAFQRVGRDPLKGPVFPHYEAPPGISPAAAHYIYNRGLSGHRALIATLMNLAVKGRISIDASDKKVTDLTRKSGGEAAGFNQEDLSLERDLFGGQDFKSLGQKYDAGFTVAYTEFKKALADKYGNPYFRWNAIYTVLAIGVTAVAIGYAVSHSMHWTVWHTVGVLALAALNAIFLYLMPAPTPEGQKVRTEIEGLRLYMDTAEKLQLNAVDVTGKTPPPMTKERYERFLPYAVALGVEEPWTKHFQKLIPAEAATYTPVWGNFGSSGFPASGVSSAISHMSSGVTSALPQSSSSSGSGGGGFSGGGGGGGGGGGW